MDVTPESITGLNPAEQQRVENIRSQETRKPLKDQHLFPGSVTSSGTELRWRSLGPSERFLVWIHADPQREEHQDVRGERQVTDWFMFHSSDPLKTPISIPVGFISRPGIASC